MVKSHVFFEGGGGYFVRALNGFSITLLPFLKGGEPQGQYQVGQTP